ncbi:MAG: leucyl aminopeptidase family protein, partial [Variovorax sp.]
LEAHRFDAAAGSLLAWADADGGIAGAVAGIGDPLDPYAHAHIPAALPAGDWHVAPGLDDEARKALQLGWGLGLYRFDRYKQNTRTAPRLVDTFDDETFAVLAACVRVRDLVNTPTEHMGPDELETVARELAATHGAMVEVIAGDALLAQNYPAIHAVGRASHRAPRIIELAWGDPAHPHVVICGKGVCFDTGGLDLKAAAGMRNMKKDMGGAAHALALAGLVMARKLPLRITLLVAAVENAVGPNAFRPGEVIATRKGVSIEVDNTDAEGRLVLCDALARAGELAPDLLLDFATLTGAARVALGPDLPALYANDDTLAHDWLAAGQRTRDPLWR